MRKPKSPINPFSNRRVTPNLPARLPCLLCKTFRNASSYGVIPDPAGETRDNVCKFCRIDCPLGFGVASPSVPRTSMTKEQKVKSKRTRREQEDQSLLAISQLLDGYVGRAAPNFVAVRNGARGVLAASRRTTVSKGGQRAYLKAGFEPVLPDVITRTRVSDQPALTPEERSAVRQMRLSLALGDAERALAELGK